uniref:uncharacterized protein isoform X2 n=1 Tax=Myxine glutinosa TaxID=7769 RepID=UPI00358F9B71
MKPHFVQIRAELFAEARRRLPFAMYALLRRVVAITAGFSTPECSVQGPDSRGLLDAILATLSGLSRELISSLQRFSALGPEDAERKVTEFVEDVKHTGQQFTEAPSAQSPLVDQAPVEVMDVGIEEKVPEIFELNTDNVEHGNLIPACAADTTNLLPAPIDNGYGECDTIGSTSHANICIANQLPSPSVKEPVFADKSNEKIKVEDDETSCKCDTTGYSSLGTICMTNQLPSPSVKEPGSADEGTERIKLEEDDGTSCCDASAHLTPAPTDVGQVFNCQSESAWPIVTHELSQPCTGCEASNSGKAEPTPPVPCLEQEEGCFNWQSSDKMPREYKRKTNRGASKDVLRRAAHEVRQGRSIRSVASDFNIDRMTLQRFIVRCTETHQPHGNMLFGYENLASSKKIFSDQMENDLAKYIKDLINQFHGLSPQKCRELAFKFAVLNHIDVPPNWHRDKEAGREWFATFRRRHNLLVK